MHYVAVCGVPLLQNIIISLYRLFSPSICFFLTSIESVVCSPSLCWCYFAVCLISRSLVCLFFAVYLFAWLIMCSFSVCSFVCLLVHQLVWLVCFRLPACLFFLLVFLFLFVCLHSFVHMSVQLSSIYRLIACSSAVPFVSVISVSVFFAISVSAFVFSLSFCILCFCYLCFRYLRFRYVCLCYLCSCYPCFCFLLFYFFVSVFSFTVRIQLQIDWKRERSSPKVWPKKWQQGVCCLTSAN